MLSRIFRLLASQNLALVLIGALTVAVIAGGTLPQSARLSVQELNAWHQEWPLAAFWLERLGLADVFGSAGFIALCAVLLVNLAAGTVMHLACLSAWFKGEVPARTLSLVMLPPDLQTLADAGENGRCRGSWGLAGLPLFHAGIALIVVAAVIHASQGLGAHFELAEGEVLSEAKGKLLLERGSRPPDGELGFRLRLDTLLVDLEDGHFRDLQARLSLQQAGGPLRQETLALNHPLDVGPYRVFLDKNVGQTAVFERTLRDGQHRRLLINFIVERESWGKSTPLVRDEVMMFEDSPMVFRMVLEPGAESRLRLRAERDGQAVFDGILLADQETDLGPYRLRFIGTALWAGLYLASDQAITWIFAGFGLSLAGFALHLLVRPRRLRWRRDGDRWLLEAWVLRDDWRFDRQWRDWERGR